MKKSLGKGLDALFGEEIEEKIENIEGKNTSAGITELKVTEVEPNTKQPRKMFDQEKIDSLAESIKENGIMQPIVVSKAGDTYKIIAGERRWRAARVAGLKTVPVIIRNDMTDSKILELALIENIQRQDLNAIETAKAIKELMEEHALTQEELAKTLGKSRSAIANTLRILNLDERVQEMVQEGKLTEGHARTLASIESPQKQYKLAMDIINLDLSVRDAEELTKEEKAATKKKSQKKETSKLEIIYKDIENRLKKALETKVSFRPMTKSRGKIIIEYYTSEELERILEILEK